MLSRTYATRPRCLSVSFPAQLRLGWTSCALIWADLETAGPAAAWHCDVRLVHRMLSLTTLQIKYEALLKTIASPVCPLCDLR